MLITLALDYYYLNTSISTSAKYGLDTKLNTNIFIYNKLINACQNISTCQYACFKLAENLASFINDLFSFIITFQKANPDNMQT